MITRKHLLIAIAATCLLTTFVLTVAPIMSAVYDPSLDENHDGKIDGKDIALPALIYGTSGDPTLNVVTTANTSENTYYTTINDLSSWMFYANVAGFRKVTVSFDGTYPTFAANYNISVGFSLAPYPNSTYQVDGFYGLAFAASPFPIPPNPPNVLNYTTRTYDVTGSQIWICIYNPYNQPGTTLTMWFSIFMTA